MHSLTPGSPDNTHARRPRWLGWLLLAPMLAWLLLFVVVPMGILFVYSFCQRDDLGRVVFSFTWENYERVFTPIYLAILWRSVLFAALTTALCVGIGYPVAWYIARRDGQPTCTAPFNFLNEYLANVGQFGNVRSLGDHVLQANPLPRRHHAAIDVENARQFLSIERHLPRPGVDG